MTTITTTKRVAGYRFAALTGMVEVAGMLAIALMTVATINVML